MKTITAILIFISAGAFAQKKSVELKYEVLSDTLSGNVITYEKDGLLKRKSGKAVRKISVFENRRINPEVTEILYYLDNWTAIKPEEVYDFKTKQ